MGTLEYTIKKCKSITFAQTESEAIKILPREAMMGKIIYFTDPDLPPENTSVRRKAVVYNSFKDAILVTDSKATIFIRLGFINEETVKKPITSDVRAEIDVISMKSQVESGIMTDEMVTTFKDMIMDIFEDKVTVEFPLDRKFQLFLAAAYLNVTDTVAKLKLLNLLRDYPDIIELEAASKPIYKDVTEHINRNTKLFSDVGITNEREDSVSNKGIRTQQNALIRAANGGSVQLTAFNTGKISVIHGRGPAGVDKAGDGNDYTIIDSLSRNGVVSIPQIKEINSLNNMISYLRKFKDFNIVFIHPSLHRNAVTMHVPCEEIEPIYVPGEGEICAVVYCLITRFFFPCCNVEEESNRDWIYAP